MQDQEGSLEGVSTYFYLDTALLKFSESVLSETKIFNMKMFDTHFKSQQNQFLHLDTEQSCQHANPFQTWYQT